MQRTLLTAVVSAVFFTTLSCAPVEAGRQTMGPAGGSITLRSGLTVEVPEGALEREVELHVRDIALGHGEHEVELEPRGTVLKVPGTLSVDDDGRRVEAMETEHGLLGVHRHGNRVEVHFERLGHVSLRRFDDSSWADGGSDHAAGDDHGRHGNRADDSANAGDDHGRHGNGSDDPVDAGDDRGGLRDGGSDDPADAGDDRGGLRDGGASGTAGTACVDDDTCPCGSECVTGFCSAVVTCTTTSDCATGLTCREGRRHGQTCGVLACNP